MTVMKDNTKWLCITHGIVSLHPGRLCFCGKELRELKEDPPLYNEYEQRRAEGKEWTEGPN